MTTTTPAGLDDSAVERQIRENINTLMMRERLSERRLAERVGIHRAALNRRMTGEVGFLYFEVRAIARFFGVTLDELEDQLPAYDAWRARQDGYAIRDSNPEPADSVCRVLPFPLVSVKATLTPNERTEAAG